MQIRTILGRLTRRSAAVVLAVGMAIGLGAAPVDAGIRGHIAVTIPFEFRAGRSAMPAGEYTIREIKDGVLSLTCETGDHTLVLARSENSGKSGDGTASLVFACYGPDRFLSEVRAGYDGTRFRMAKTKSEERLAAAQGAPGTTLVITGHGR